MIRTMFAVASVAAVALGVTVAVAQQDVIKERKAIMKANGDQAKIGRLHGERRAALSPCCRKQFCDLRGRGSKDAELVPG